MASTSRVVIQTCVAVVKRVFQSCSPLGLRSSRVASRQIHRDLGPIEARLLGPVRSQRRVGGPAPPVPRTWAKPEFLRQVPSLRAEAQVGRGCSWEPPRTPSSSDRQIVCKWPQWPWMGLPGASGRWGGGAAGGAEGGGEAGGGGRGEAGGQRSP